MWCINRLKYLLPVFFLLFLLSFRSNNEWSPALQNKVNNALYKVYETEHLRLQKALEEPVEIGKQSNSIDQQLYKIIDEDVLKGYAYVGQAPSMKNVFDYIVILNTELEIVKSKVLIYREQHGRQIGTARWLDQFNGMKITDRPKLGVEVDGISGATISATSMTKAIHNLLNTLSHLRANKII